MDPSLEKSTEIIAEEFGSDLAMLKYEDSRTVSTADSQHITQTMRSTFK